MMIKDKKNSEIIGFEIFDKIASFPLTNKYRDELNSNIFQLFIEVPCTLTAPGLNFWENGGLIWKFCSSGISLALGLDILNFTQCPRSAPALLRVHAQHRLGLFKNLAQKGKEKLWSKIIHLLKIWKIFKSKILWKVLSNIAKNC